jgi:hypothetical protein
MNESPQTLSSVDELSAEETRILANWSKREKLPEAQVKARLAVLSKIQERRFDLENPPAELKPRWTLAGKPIATPGNICVPQSQAGTGKSAFVGAFISARIAAEEGKTDCDLLGLQADPDAKGSLLLIDTEQSRFDFDANVRRALRRAGSDKEPEWLKAYGLAGYSANDLKKIVAALLWEAELDGAYGVIIDGVADLCADVNDAEECNAFVARLQNLAIKHDCPIICVLHENPGSENGKGRGHLGSQLERKAESVLRLQKTDDVTAVFSKKARRAPIMEKDAPRFIWSNEAGMHVSVASASTLREDENLSDLRELADEVFASDALRYADACQKIETARRVGSKAGEKWFTRMKKANVIHNVGLGMWRVKTS